MSNLIKDLLTPEQGRLLDNQLRQQKLNQGVTNYGSDAIGKLLTSVSGAQRASAGFGMLGERLMGGRQKGVNEMQAERAQQKQEQILSSAKEQAKNAIYATPAIGEQAASNLLMAIEKDPTGRTAEQVVKKYGMPDAPSNTSAAFIKAVQLGINNGSISSESGIAAIEAEQKQPGSGSALLEYPNEDEDANGGGALSAGDKKRYNKLLDETSRLRRMNTETGAITSLLDTIDPSSGAVAKVGKAIKTVFGTEDVESVLRARIESIRVAQAIGNLPPGIASDKDIELVLGGTLPSTANPEALKEWFNALERLNSIAIEEQEAQLAYFDKNESMKGFFTERREHNLKRSAELEAKRAKELEKTVKAEQARVEAKRAKVKALEEQKAIKNQSINVSAEVGNFQEFL